MMAFVFGVKTFSMLCAVIFPLSRSTSAKMGLALALRMQETLAMKDRGVTMTSSPGPILCANKDKIRAEVPLLTTEQNLAPVKFFKESVIPCVIVSIASFILGLIPFYSMDSSLIRLISVIMVISFSFLLLSYSIILNQSEKDITKRLLMNVNFFKVNK